MRGFSSARRRSALKRLLKCPWGGDGGGRRAGQALQGPATAAGPRCSDLRLLGFVPGPRRNAAKAAAAPTVEAARRWRRKGLGAVKLLPGRGQRVRGANGH